MSTPANPDDLITWLRARYDERERVARAAIAATGWEREGGTGRWEADGNTGGVSDECGATVVYDEGLPTVEQSEHIAGNDPAYVLAGLDAKRRILDDYEAALAESDSDPNDPTRSADASTLEWVVRLLALPFADRPGYREEWRP